MNPQNARRDDYVENVMANLAPRVGVDQGLSLWLATSKQEERHIIAGFAAGMRHKARRLSAVWLARELFEECELELHSIPVPAFACIAELHYEAFTQEESKRRQLAEAIQREILSSSSLVKLERYKKGEILQLIRQVYNECGEEVDLEHARGWARELVRRIH